VAPLFPDQVYNPDILTITRASIVRFNNVCEKHYA